MTVAICTRCGARKRGALTRCPGCGFEPKENEDKAKALILSDRWIPKKEMENVSARIRKSEPLDYPAGMLTSYVRAFEQNPDALKSAMPRKIGWVVAAAAIAATLVWMALR